MEGFAGAKLSDGRLFVQLIKLVARFSDKPTASIPGACPDWVETQGVYLFRSSQLRQALTELARHPRSAHRPEVSPDAPQHPVILCLQDSTEQDFNGQGINGLGPLSYESQCGMYLHPTYVVTPEREPLGITDAWMWAREPKAAEGTHPGSRHCRTDAAQSRIVKPLSRPKQSLAGNGVIVQGQAGKIRNNSLIVSFMIAQC